LGTSTSKVPTECPGPDAGTRYVDSTGPAARTVIRAAHGVGLGRSRGTDKDQLAKIREWARTNGHQVSDRGPVSTAVQEAYHTAN
jgi:hypothetical protein